jgi:lantibiotic biosynthesis protein
MSSTPAERDALLAAAERIGARLVREAIWAGPRCAWVAPVDPEGLARPVDLVYHATGPTLYDGAAGAALFLAELFAATGEPLFRTTALGAAAHAVSRLDDVAPELRIGLHEGWTGIALAVERVAAAVDGGEDLAAAARAAVEGLRPTEEWVYDVIAGAAGAIPALLRLGGERALEQATLEGERLLAAADDEGDATSWPVPGRPRQAHLFGASHGASGIGVGLLELGVHTGDERFLKASRRAFAFESERFRPEHGTCPDLRAWVTEGGGDEVCHSSWCHGAAGAALTRLRADALAPDARVRAEARAAVAACRAAAAGDAGSGDVSLCHGAAGLGEALVAGGEEDAARELAGRHAQAILRGEVSRSGRLSGAPVPALMLGDAGLGHHFLRLCAPRRVESVLQVAPLAAPARDGAHRSASLA